MAKFGLIFLIPIKIYLGATTCVLVIKVFFYFFHTKFVKMDLAIYGLVHDWVTVFGLCKKLKAYKNYLLNMSDKKMQFSSHHSILSRDFKVALAE